MANISQFIQKIRSAIYGEEVRGSIADALTAMNTETESYVEQAAAQVELAKYYSEVAEQSVADYTEVLEKLGDEDISEVGTSVTNAINNLAEGGEGLREKTWEEWEALTPEEQEALGDVIVIDCPPTPDVGTLQTEINQLNQDLNAKTGTIQFPSGNADLVVCERSGNVVSFGARIGVMNVPYGSPLLILPEGFRPNTSKIITLACSMIVNGHEYSSSLFGVNRLGEVMQEKENGTVTSLQIYGTFIV